MSSQLGRGGWRNAIIMAKMATHNCVRFRRPADHGSSKSAFHVFLIGAPMFAGTPLIVEQKRVTASDSAIVNGVLPSRPPLELEIRI